MSFKLGSPEWVDNEIHREHSLISDRMNWYVASQSFLLLAFTISTANNHLLTWFLKWGLPIVGLAVSVFTGIALFAAISTITMLRKRQLSQCNREEVREEDYVEFWYTTRPPWHLLGFLPPVFIPILFSAIWIGLLSNVGGI